MNKVMLRKDVTNYMCGKTLPKDTILDGDIELETKKVLIEVAPYAFCLISPKDYVICKNDNGMVEYHRLPNAYEIKFGEGDIHYLDIPESVCRKQNGDLKKWLVYGGERYYY